MIAKNMAVTRINLLHKIWCNIQKNDHMMATYDQDSVTYLVTQAIAAWMAWPIKANHNHTCAPQFSA
jgi:hypothetical protein